MFAAFSAQSIMQATFERLSGSQTWSESIAIRERLFPAAKGSTSMIQMSTDDREVNLRQMIFLRLRGRLHRDKSPWTRLLEPR